MSVWFVTKGFCGLCAWASRGALMMAGAVLALEVPRVLETDASETVRVVTVDPYRNVDCAAAQHNIFCLDPDAVLTLFQPPV